ncbi:Tim44 domain-containing protein [Leptospira interrogans]
MSFSRLSALVVALASGFSVIAADLADARGGRSFGSRGSKTYTAPPATNTAPKAAPIERSMTPKSAPSSAQPGAAAAATQAQASRFGGMRGLLMGSLFAVGLASIFGFGALASVLGFVLQFALIAGLAYLVLMFVRSRNQPALARANAQQGGGRTPQRDMAAPNRQGFGLTGRTPSSPAPLTISQTDLDSFEKLLGEVHTAYSREDVDKLGAIATPEMLSYFSQELSDSAKQGLRNDVSNVKLLQGDVSEAWREAGSDYATVAMRYSQIEVTVERETGQVVSGDRSQPTEATEFWTFRRDDRTRGEGWQLSAIQQAA